MCDATNLPQILSHLRAHLLSLKDEQELAFQQMESGAYNTLGSKIYQCEEDILEVEIEMEELEKNQK